MGRPKGSKNKAAPVVEKGNPDFNINDAEPVDPSWRNSVIAPSAPTQEDYALDRHLDDMIAQSPEPRVSDVDPSPVVVKQRPEPYTLLSEFEDDYIPATTRAELEDQVYRAKQAGADSVEASPDLIYYFIKDKNPKPGYFVFSDIKVYIAGFFEQSVKRERITIEQKTFGDSKIL